MTLAARIDAAMTAALARASAAPAPAKLGHALTYATTPGGARIRPTILVSVAGACGESNMADTDAAAVALEFMHCASLVHDDLPAFDNADLRRGKPSVHVAYSEPLAILTGDSLIIAAFENLMSVSDPAKAVALSRILSRRSGMPYGICAGQGWESEADIDLSAYHRAKTGALFIAATQMGAVAAGYDPEPWEDLGARIGEAFQVADDLRDALYFQEALGKPAGQDDLHGRPNAVTQLGVSGAIKRLKDILSGAIASIPSCPGEAALAALVNAYAAKMVPTRKPIPGE